MSPAAPLRALIERAGLSDTEAANLLGVTRQAVWQWRTGQRPLDGPALRLVILVEHFGLDKTWSVLEAKVRDSKRSA